MPIVTDAVRQADQSNPNGYYEFEPVKDLDKATEPTWLASAHGKAVKIISFLLTYLPESHDYQVILMRRDVDEIIASQNLMLQARGEPLLGDDTRLKATYAEHLRQVERFLAKRDCFTTLDLDYHQVLASPAEEAARVNAFLGDRLDVTKMAAVADRTLYRNRLSRTSHGRAFGR